jgi:HlyD family secretion protein
MKILRKLLIVAAAVAVIGAIVWAYRAPAIAVDVVAAGRGALEVTTEEDGRTRIRERYVLAPPVTGFMHRVEVHAGDAVHKGQVLFSLEPLPPESLDVRSRAEAGARVARAEAAVREAETTAKAAAAQADYASRDEGRKRPLYEGGQISRSDYDRIASEAERAAAESASARAAIEVARYELQAARTALRYAGGERPADGAPVPVATPVDGVILTVQREDEGVVAAGQPVLTVGDPHSLEVVVDVLSADAVRIRPGMTVRLERWGGDEPLQARVRTVDPTAFTKVSALGVEEQRVEVVADLVSPVTQWVNLGDGYRVEARFILWRADDALRVPHSSLFRVGPDWALFVVKNGRAQRRMVKLGQRGAFHAQVLDGIADGERVVAYPEDRLTDGARVRVREVGTP